jgi:hypothetical protein
MEAYLDALGVEHNAHDHTRERRVRRRRVRTIAVERC